MFGFYTFSVIYLLAVNLITGSCLLVINFKNKIYDDIFTENEYWPPKNKALQPHSSLNDLPNLADQKVSISNVANTLSNSNVFSGIFK